MNRRQEIGREMLVMALDDLLSAFTADHEALIRHRPLGPSLLMASTAIRLMTTELEVETIISELHMALLDAYEGHPDRQAAVDYLNSVLDKLVDDVKGLIK
jgi:hypothetical protein